MQKMSLKLRGFLLLYVTFGCMGRMTDESRLYADLLIDYNRMTRPVLDQNSSMEIQMYIELVAITELDMKEEALSIYVYQTLIWKDELLVWNPDDYGGIKVLRNV